MNKLLRSVGLLTAPIILMCGALAQADQFDKSTKVTVDQAIEISGTVLPAGTYIFRLADPNWDNQTVQIYNENRDHILATVLTIPEYRLEPTGKAVLDLGEAPAGKPVPVRAWFYPGENVGREFVNLK